MLPELSTGSSRGKATTSATKRAAPRTALRRVNVNCSKCHFYSDTHMQMKSHFQCVCSTRAPANKAPMSAPTGGDVAKNASVMLRVLPGDSIMVSVATALGMMIPPPIPVRARAATNELYVVQNAFIREKMATITTPSKSNFWWPYTAPSRPLMRTNVLCVSLKHGVSYAVYI